MKKYFICSDIHSFYTPLITSLEKKGFNINNPEHILVVLGDVFDRGYETLEVYAFLTVVLPEDRLILVRGNHELLYLDLLKKDFPDSYDFSNGTVRTFCQIARFDEKVLEPHYWYKEAFKESKDDGDLTFINKYANRPAENWAQIKEIVAMHPITKWIQSKQWINYWETENYIFVHSFIPLQQAKKMYYIEDLGYREDWRNATQTEWEDAMWGCPWSKAKEGWNKTGKTIVCGHWHTSDFFNHLTRQRKGKYECPLFKSKKYKLIGLDACTVVSDKVNVLVLNEEEL